MMRHSLLALAVALTPMAVHAQDGAPDIVRVVGKGDVSNGLILATMESDTDRYVLLCNEKAAGCFLPPPAGRYYLFTKSTHWQIPGAKVPVDLAWIQNWTVTYPEVDNVGLVPVKPEDRAAGPPGSALGMFALESSSKR